MYLLVAYWRTMYSTACLAQSVERQALNLMVVGSSPTVGAFLFFLLKQVTKIAIKFRFSFLGLTELHPQYSPADVRKEQDALYRDGKGYAPIQAAKYVILFFIKICCLRRFQQQF